MELVEPQRDRSMGDPATVASKFQKQPEARGVSHDSTRTPVVMGTDIVLGKGVQAQGSNQMKDDDTTGAPQTIVVLGLDVIAEENVYELVRPLSNLAETPSMDESTWNSPPVIQTVLSRGRSWMRRTPTSRRDRSRSTQPAIHGSPSFEHGNERLVKSGEKLLWLAKSLVPQQQRSLASTSTARKQLGSNHKEDNALSNTWTANVVNEGEIYELIRQGSILSYSPQGTDGDASNHNDNLVAQDQMRTGAQSPMDMEDHELDCTISLIKLSSIPHGSVTSEENTVATEESHDEDQSNEQKVPTSTVPSLGHFTVEVLKQIPSHDSSAKDKLTTELSVPHDFHDPAVVWNVRVDESGDVELMQPPPLTKQSNSHDSGKGTLATMTSEDDAALWNLRVDTSNSAVELIRPLSLVQQNATDEPDEVDLVVDEKSLDNSWNLRVEDESNAAVEVVRPPSLLPQPIAKDLNKKSPSVTVDPGISSIELIRTISMVKKFQSFPHTSSEMLSQGEESILKVSKSESCQSARSDNINDQSLPDGEAHQEAKDLANLPWKDLLEILPSHLVFGFAAMLASTAAAVPYMSEVMAELVQRTYEIEEETKEMAMETWRAILEAFPGLDVSDLTEKSTDDTPYDASSVDKVENMVDTLRQMEFIEEIIIDDLRSPLETTFSNLTEEAASAVGVGQTENEIKTQREKDPLIPRLMESETPNEPIDQRKDTKDDRKSSLLSMGLKNGGSFRTWTSMSRQKRMSMGLPSTLVSQEKAKEGNVEHSTPFQFRVSKDVQDAADDGTEPIALRIYKTKPKNGPFGSSGTARGSKASNKSATNRTSTEPRKMYRKLKDSPSRPLLKKRPTTALSNRSMEKTTNDRQSPVPKRRAYKKLGSSELLESGQSNARRRMWPSVRRSNKKNWKGNVNEVKTYKLSPAKSLQPQECDSPPVLSEEVLEQAIAIKHVTHTGPSEVEAHHPNETQHMITHSSPSSVANEVQQPKAFPVVPPSARDSYMGIPISRAVGEIGTIGHMGELERGASDGEEKINHQNNDASSTTSGSSSSGSPKEDMILLGEDAASDAARDSRIGSLVLVPAYQYMEDDDSAAAYDGRIGAYLERLHQEIQRERGHAASLSDSCSDEHDEELHGEIFASSTAARQREDDDDSGALPPMMGPRRPSPTVVALVATEEPPHQQPDHHSVVSPQREEPGFLSASSGHLPPPPPPPPRPLP
mmetsp:Transcript_10087/g.20824  ORF Transcript_10087/g.20824 Transcript_10087/m.20824 type:complete len:1214 (-) Transcript_10087:123-3764(-)